MQTPSRPRKNSHCQSLRLNMTESERRLWRRLREACPGAHFRRQVTFGYFVVDFVSFRHRLVLEVDGGQHCENRDDKQRDDWMSEHGFRVLRFWNHEVDRQMDGVIDVIQRALKS